MLWLVLFCLGVFNPVWGEVQQLQRAREIINRHYMEPIDEAALTEKLLITMVEFLEDEWATYLTQAEYEEIQRRNENRFQGIGTRSVRDEYTNEWIVSETMPGSPAEEAGLRSGDTIVTIEGISTGLQTDQERAEIISSNYGGSVNLEVRDLAGEMRTVVVEVRAFDVNPVAFEMLEDNIGYVRIYNFRRPSGRETIAAIETLQEEGAEGIVFDVRNNPGGGVNEVTQVLDRLLPEGEIFVYADYAGQETEIIYSDTEYLDMPIVVLINENSASAAEYFAAVLQEFNQKMECDTITIVGVQTTGKGRSQQTHSLPRGGAIRLSTARYLTPRRRDLQEGEREERGVRPDVKEADEDFQLEKAIQILIGKLILS